MPSDLQVSVRSWFHKAFGKRTPLTERTDDIFHEALELNRFTDFDHLKEELGDTLASAIMLADELGLSYEDLVQATLQKIERRLTQYKTLARKRFVAILGGAFDPPTLGHIDVAQYVLDTSRLFDEVWLMPAYGHMNNKRMASPEERLEMCRIAVQRDRRIQVFDYEISHALSGETYHTMKLLMEDEQYKDTYNFSLIVGMDRALDFASWVNSALLERLSRFVVVPRHGYQWDGKTDWFLHPPHVFLGNSERMLRDASSTQARAALAKGDEDEGLKFLDPAVWDYCRLKGLYHQ